MLRTFVFFCVITVAVASETLDSLVNASAGFSVAILQQLAAVQSDPTPTDFAGKTVAYADAKISYYKALRAAIPDLVNTATGKEPRPPEVDMFAQSFSVADEKQEKAAPQRRRFC